MNKSVCGLLLVCSVLVCVLVTNPLFNRLFANASTANIILDHQNEGPLDMQRFTACVIDAYQTCCDPDFYYYYTGTKDYFLNKLTDYKQYFSFNGVITNYTEPFFYRLFYDIISDLSSDGEVNDLPSLRPDFFPLCYQLAVTHYFDEETYFSLLRGYNDRNTESGSHNGGSYD